MSSALAADHEACAALLRKSGSSFALPIRLLPVLAAVVTVYLVLGMLYESLIHPLTIISTLPSAGLGALLALQWTGSQLDVMAMIGIIPNIIPILPEPAVSCTWPPCVLIFAASFDFQPTWLLSACRGLAARLAMRGPL